MARMYNAFLTSGTLNTLVAGSVVNGSSVVLGDSVRAKLKMLSAVVGGTAATATLTIAGKWQVSNDNSTWVDLANGAQNAASVVLATGTSAAFVKAIPSPDCIYAYPFARFSLVTGVATGAAGDLYSIGYSLRTSRSLDG